MDFIKIEGVRHRDLVRVQPEPTPRVIRLTDGGAKDEDSKDAFRVFRGIVDAITNPAEWKEYAACRDANPDMFFAPEGEETAAAREARLAYTQTFCGRCAVEGECSIERTQQTSGVWAGQAAEDLLLNSR